MISVFNVSIEGALERYAEGFAEGLIAQKYTRLSAVNQLRLLAHVSRWLTGRGLRAKDFTEQRLLAFLRARRRAGYTCWLSRRGLQPICQYLRNVGVIGPEPARRKSRLERLLAEYARYLCEERGLAPSTIRGRTDAARHFLIRYGAARTALRAVTPAEIQAYLRTTSGGYAPGSVAGLGSHLRSLLRFLLVTGIVRRSLAEAVLPSPSWRHRPIPRGIPMSNVRAMIRSCDRQTPRGVRDYAVMMLLARLGLRAGEVCRLTIDDIDWRQGEITIHGKGSKRERLPLPHDVGKALSQYLCQRPDVSERRIFLGVTAPCRALSNVGFIVFIASQDAGIEPVRARGLRRTAATEMLRRGASLSEIAEVLRHSVTQTTAIYAKVDRRSLRSLVQPWPGAQT